MNSLQRHNFWIHLLYLDCPAVIMSRQIRCIEIFRSWSFRHSLDSNESPEHILHPDSDCGMRNNIRFMAKLRVRKSLYASSLEKQRDVYFEVSASHFPQFYSWNSFSSVWPLLSTSIMCTSDPWASSWKDRWNPILRTRIFFFTKIRRESIVSPYVVSKKGRTILSLATILLLFSFCSGCMVCFDMRKYF